MIGGSNSINSWNSNSNSNSSGSSGSGSIMKIQATKLLRLLGRIPVSVHTNKHSHAHARCH